MALNINSCVIPFLLKNDAITFCFCLSFEHSLVQELGYNGYERLRRGFDRAFGGQEAVPTFSKVVDAGCGTGLVGEQVRRKCDYALL
jgi:predicted TPR repeat methyltransferase